jgi:hypothetical protein
LCCKWHSESCLFITTWKPFAIVFFNFKWTNSHKCCKLRYFQCGQSFFCAHRLLYQLFVSYRLGSKVCPILLKSRWMSAYRSTLHVVKIIRCLYRTENSMGVVFDVTSKETGNNSLSWRVFFLEQVLKQA